MRRPLIPILILSIIGVSIIACNLPGIGQSTATSQSPTVVMDEANITEKPDQGIDLPPTEVAGQASPEAAQGEPTMTAKGPVDCRATPMDESDTIRVFSAGDTAPVMGKTPNGKWYAIKDLDRPQPCWVPAIAVELNVNPAILENILPPTTPTPSLGSISGVLWHELCEFTGGEGGEPVVLGQGCVQWGEAEQEFGPNQIYDPFEEGWPGVTLHLGLGACPSMGPRTTMTNSDGEYEFDGISSGVYCVSYNALADGNDSILIPGGPTFPERGEGGFFQTVTLDEGENAIDVNFGYAWQFFN